MPDIGVLMGRLLLPHQMVSQDHSARQASIVLKVSSRTKLIKLINEKSYIVNG